MDGQGRKQLQIKYAVWRGYGAVRVFIVIDLWDGGEYDTDFGV